MEKQKSSLPYVIRSMRPLSLVVGGLFFFLGIGIVKYLGYTILWDRLWLGLGMAILLQVSSYLLNAQYEFLEATSPLRKMQKDVPIEDQAVMKRIPKQGFLMLSITTLTAGAVLTVVMVSEGAISLPTLIILGSGFLLAFFYAVPPLRLINRGYGELAEAILVASLVPAFAFQIQTGELHRFILVFAFPLIALFLAMRIAQSLEKYALDLKLGRRTLLVTLGWQRSMALHNILIGAGYLLLVIGGLTGLPWSLTWPGLLTIPIGIFQIYQLNQIAAGAKPGWLVLRLTAASLLVLTVYLIILALLTG